MVKLAISGACGRMGRRLGMLSAGDDELQVVCPLECAGHAELGSDYGELLGLGASGIAVSEALTGPVDVLIDFSSPAATVHWVERCREQKVAMVIGTTGLTERENALIDSAAKAVAIVQAPNMSVGVNLLFRMLGPIAKSLGADYDVEIVEAHHRFKKDAPSGTALGLLKSVCEGLDVDPDRAAVFGRHGSTDARKPGQIGVHAVRMGDVVGQHTVHFGTMGETVSISHTAHSRDTFAQGALRAAKWVATKTSGRYSMQHVLFGD